MPKIVAPPKSEVIERHPIIITCPNCQYTISYTEDEVERVTNDGNGILCPNCDKVIVTEPIEPFTFPNTFCYHGEKDGTIPLTNEQVQKYVNIVKHALQQEIKVGEYTSAISGDTMVFGFKFEDEDLIYVTKNYWVDSILKEN
nr:MAG TPA: DNA-directed RNA polymerase [Caudoviricetes sp.]